MRHRGRTADAGGVWAVAISSASPCEAARAAVGPSAAHAKRAAQRLVSSTTSVTFWRCLVSGYLLLCQKLFKAITFMFLSASKPQFGLFTGQGRTTHKSAHTYKYQTPCGGARALRHRCKTNASATKPSPLQTTTTHRLHYLLYIPLLTTAAGFRHMLPNLLLTTLRWPQSAAQYH